MIWLIYLGSNGPPCREGGGRGALVESTPTFLTLWWMYDKHDLHQTHASI